jgi:hypothetical protein
MARSGNRPLSRRPAVLAALGLGAVAVVVGLAVFQPWKLVVDRTVDEVAPGAVVDARPRPGETAPSPLARPAPAAEPVLLASGELISHEHETTGTVQVLRLPDGSRVLRLRNLDTSNGPLLKVWITDAPVIAGRAGWHVFDDGRYVDLGELKGNVGSSNYVLPRSVDLTQLTAVSIWCDRFNVSFGAAALKVRAS